LKKYTKSATIIEWPLSHNKHKPFSGGLLVYTGVSNNRTAVRRSRCPRVAHWRPAEIMDNRPPTSRCVLVLPNVSRLRDNYCYRVTSAAGTSMGDQ